MLGGLANLVDPQRHAGRRFLQDVAEEHISRLACHVLQRNKSPVHTRFVLENKFK